MTEEQNDIEQMNDGTASDNQEADIKQPVPPSSPEQQQHQQNDQYAQYKTADGNYDFDKIFKDLTTERERADGLRKKLSDQKPGKKVEPFSVDDLSISIPEEERDSMADILKTFNDIGLSKEQAEKVFEKLSSNIVDEKQMQQNAENDYQEELKKLGKDKDVILGTLRNFSDTMLSNKIWTDDQKKAFEGMIYSADIANAMYSAIQNINVLRAGNFSSMPANSSPAPTYSQRDKVDMYRRAFEMMKTNPSDGEAEMKRLDKLFGMN